MAYYRVGLTWNLCFIPVAMFLTLLAAFGAGALLSALNVKYRDFPYVIPFLVQFWMYCSPVIYPATIFHAKWRWLLSLNPMSGIIDSYRRVF
jgi:lipopolysaccharide transport system permease protein